MMVIKQTINNYGINEFWFDNNAWCSVDLEGSYEYQSDVNDGETYIEGELEFDDKVLVDYDGCFDLPKEVCIAVIKLGYQLDDFITDEDLTETPEFPSPEFNNEDNNIKNQKKDMKTNQNNATVANNNGALNPNIIRLQEFTAVKMAKISSGKRPAAKFNKEVATYLLENWDNLGKLQECYDAMRKDMPHESCEEVMHLYDIRMEELEDKAKGKKAPAAKKATKPAKSVIDYAKLDKFKGNPDKELNDEERQAWSILNGYYASEDEPALRKDKSLKDLWKYIDERDSKEAKKKPAEPETAVAKRGRKTTHYVGETHPDNPNIVWTEWRPGQFDWKSKNGKYWKGKEKPQEAKETTTTKVKVSKSDKAAKGETELTLDEIMAKPIPSGLSKPQQAVMKAIKKGYRIRQDGNVFWLTNKDGDNIRTEKSVLEALQRKFRINYTPKGICYKK